MSHKNTKKLASKKVKIINFPKVNLIFPQQLKNIFQWLVPLWVLTVTWQSHDKYMYMYACIIYLSICCLWPHVLIEARVAQSRHFPNLMSSHKSHLCKKLFFPVHLSADPKRAWSICSYRGNVTSSKSCSRTVRTSGWAFSTSSKRTTAFGHCVNEEVNCPPWS